MSESDHRTGPAGTPADFATTHWSVVLRAARDDQAQMAALEELCRNYWRPIYTYVRRRGSSPEEAQDLTQSFFERLLEKNWLADVDPERARFRSFLLTMVSRFITNEYHRAHSQKRGGKAFHFSIQDPELENQLVASPGAGSPEQDFDRHWALTVLERALQRLKTEAAESGKQTHFVHLSPYLSQEAEPGDYARLATQLKMSAGTVAVSVHRLRHRYRELVRSEIGETLSHQADTDLEMNHLMAALR
ncbi:MAG: sigma-70 family RNA polymerase sigma factor [Verrucomicrobiales bacterium]|nr:sigma-70 family RNA polymerase sigma factor [Verrucomicrobiales bacterium]